MPRLKRELPVEPVDISILDTLTFRERLAIGLERLKAERGVTNRMLAEQIGLDEAYISRVARGMRDLRLSSLDKMQRAWNVSADDLLKLTEADLPLIAVWKARRRKKRATEAAP